MASVLTQGHSNRHTAATLMNARSSRSHAIFIITVEVLSFTPVCANAMQSSTTGPTGKPQVKKGVLNLVDLAGSERQKKTQASVTKFFI